MNLTLNSAKKKIEALNGHSKPAEEKKLASKARQVEIWQAMVSWFAGDHSIEVHQKLIWEPACTLSPLLPQPPRYQHGVDNPLEAQCLSEHWKERVRLSLSWIIEDWLSEGIPVKQLKEPRFLRLAIEEAGKMITLLEWGPILLSNYKYYEQNPASEVQEHWTILYPTHRLNIRRYIDGRIGKQFNNEQIPPEPDSKTPHYYRGPLETNITSGELKEIFEQCM